MMGTQTQVNIHGIEIWHGFKTSYTSTYRLNHYEKKRSKDWIESICTHEFHPKDDDLKLSKIYLNCFVHNLMINIHFILN